MQSYRATGVMVIDPHGLWVRMGEYYAIHQEIERERERVGLLTKQLQVAQVRAMKLEWSLRLLVAAVTEARERNGPVPDTNDALIAAIGILEK